MADMRPWKPPGKSHLLTRGEVAKLVGRDRRQLARNEARGDIPAPIRHKVGSTAVRVYAPDDVEKIIAFYKKRDRIHKSPKARKHRLYMREWKKRKGQEHGEGGSSS